jgi:HTH-type transcriptional regulator / antitoxin HipB
MRFRSPAELGAIIRERRRKLGLEQKALAEQVGVSRQWIIDIEKGKPRAALGLVLRTVNALGILLDASDEPAGKSGKSAAPHDIDAIIAAARKLRS